MPERSGQRDGLHDFLTAAFLDFLGWSVGRLSDDDQDATAADGMSHAQTVVHVGPRLSPRLGAWIRQTDTPMSMVDRIVTENPAFLHGRPRLLHREPARFIKIHPIKPSVASHLQPLNNRQRLVPDFIGNHAEFTAEQDAPTFGRRNDRLGRGSLAK